MDQFPWLFLSESYFCIYTSLKEFMGVFWFSRKSRPTFHTLQMWTKTKQFRIYPLLPPSFLLVSYLYETKNIEYVLYF